MRLLFLVLLLWFPKLTAQVNEPKPMPLTIESFGYPDFGKGYDFGDFSVQYPLTTDVDAIIKGMHQKTPIFEVFQTQLLLRKKLGNKLYGTTGLTTEWRFSMDDSGSYLIDPKGDKARQEAFLGLEYEPRPDILIHVGYGRLLNQPKLAPLGFMRPNAKDRFTLGSKFKF